MRPPRGFEAEKWPLRHRIVYAYAVTHGLENANTVFMPIVRASKATTATSPLTNPDTIQVNPHNANYEEDSGPLCGQMSIIDRMTISLKFNMTQDCNPKTWTSGNSNTAPAFTGDGLKTIRGLWRPIFGAFAEKLDAADDDTTNTVAAILGLTKDATNEDVVAVTTNKLSGGSVSDLNHPLSTVNGVEAITDYNYTTNTAMEDHVFDEDLLHSMLRRGTNKGALRSCLGRTRHFTLTTNRPSVSFYIDKFVPRAIRRIVPFGFFGIQIHFPFVLDVEQAYISRALTGVRHVGVKMTVNYHEWNSEHDQDRGVPT